MNQQLSKQSRRVWIIVNYISVALIVFFFYFGRFFEKPIVFFVGGGLSLFIAGATFYKTFVTTQLWRIVHSAKNSLDERQMQVVLNALRYSYSAFAIFVLLLIYAFALMDKEPINVLVAVCILYLAHTLPAAVVGWSEKVI
jgi:hypothetical protein